MRNGPYILVVAPKDYPGKKYRDRYCYEHHLVWWKNTGQLPRIGYIVHHRDGDKHHNEFSNLEEISWAGHTHHHRRLPTMVTMVCGECGKEFQRRRNSDTRRWGCKMVFCNRSCMGRHWSKTRKWRPSKAARSHGGTTLCKSAGLTPN